MGLPGIFDPKARERAGLITLALGLAAMGFLLLWPQYRWRSASSLYVQVEHKAGLERGSPVRLAGAVVGRVVDIRLTPEGATSQLDSPQPHASAPNATLTLEVKLRDSLWSQLPANAEFFVASTGLFGAKYLQVAPPRGAIASADKLTPGSHIRATTPPNLAGLFTQTPSLSDHLRALWSDIEPDYHKLRAAVVELIEISTEMTGDHALAKTASSLVEQWQKLSEAAARHNVSLSGSLTNTYALLAEARTFAIKFEQSLPAVRASLTRLSETLRKSHAQVRVRRIVEQLDKFEPKLRRTRTALDAVAAAVSAMQQGQGTLGGLRYDPEFSDLAKELGKAIKDAPWRVLLKPRAR